MNNYVLTLKKYLSKFNLAWLRVLLPKDVKIISGAEIILYLIFFAMAVWTYNTIQKVPVHQDIVTIKRIHADSLNKHFYYYFNVEYVIPMTFALNESKGNGSQSVILKFNENLKDTSVVNENDSLMSIYRSKTSFSLLPIFYIAFSQHHTIFESAGISFREEFWHVPDNNQKDRISQAIYKNGYYVQEHITPYPGEYKTKDEDTWLHSRPLSRPRWFSNYDVSQSYYHIEFDTDLDSGRVCMDFVGFTEFSNMVPTPDTITMSSIIFSGKDKIRELKSNGLKFHAKHSELQGFQNSRVFFLTTMMSALFAIFITFIVLGLLKLARRDKSNKEGLKNNGNSSKV